jgi:Ca-activated chloride channel family protein
MVARLITVLLLITSPPLPGQMQDETDEARFRSDPRMVLLPTTGRDRQGVAVGGLSRDAFRVAQDHVPQQIAFLGEEDVPVSMGIVFDKSGSMQPVLSDAANAMRSFFQTANPEDEAFLFTVSTRPRQDCAFTQDLETLLGSQLFSDPGGSTALNDTIYAALGQMRAAHRERRAMLVISDGMDNHSHHTARELMAFAAEADVQIYSISVFDPPRNKKPVELREQHEGILFLAELAHKTGGIQMVVYDRRDVERAAQLIGDAIRHQYLIGYVPAQSDKTGKWHSIQVNVDSVEGATVNTRLGFLAK